MAQSQGNRDGGKAVALITPAPHQLGARWHMPQKLNSYSILPSSATSRPGATHVHEGRDLMGMDGHPGLDDGDRNQGLNAYLLARDRVLPMAAVHHHDVKRESRKRSSQTPKGTELRALTISTGVQRFSAINRHLLL